MAQAPGVAVLREGRSDLAEARQQGVRDSGCARLLTEDLSHGQVFDGVEVVNPFA